MEKPAAPAEKKVAKQSTLKGILIGGGIGVLLAAVTWFAGGWSARNAAQGRIASLKSSEKQAQAQVARLRETGEVLRAQGHLYQAATDLERRNYGSASEDLRRADQMLDGVDAAAAGLDAAQLKEVGQALEGIDLTVQSDVGEQRTRVLDLAGQLGNLVPDTPGE